MTETTVLPPPTDAQLSKMVEPKVMLALPTYDHLEPKATWSLLREVVNTFPKHAQIHSSVGTLIAQARNQLAYQAVCGYYAGKVTHILWWDSDMLFPQSIKETHDNIVYNIGLTARLLRARQRVVGALCYDRKGDVVIRCMDGTNPKELPEHGLVQCGATGFACVLMEASVLAEMFERYGDLPFQTPASNKVDTTGVTGMDKVEKIMRGQKIVGEDIFFYARLNEMKIPLFIDLDTKVGHLKPMVIGHQAYDEHDANLQPS